MRVINVNNMKQLAYTSNGLFIRFLALVILVGSFMSTAHVHAAPAGCYVQSSGAATNSIQITVATCPNSSADDAARYSTGCWISTASSQGQTPYRSVDCASLTVGTVQVQTTPTPTELPEISTGDLQGQHQCGSGDRAIRVSFNFGCKGASYGRDLNPIIDVAFAIFRFLSAGVGLVVIGSIIVAGIQYSASRGNPQATEAAKKRIVNALSGLMLYIFLFAIANFLVPGGMFL